MSKHDGVVRIQDSPCGKWSGGGQTRPCGGSLELEVSDELIMSKIYVNVQVFLCTHAYAFVYAHLYVCVSSCVYAFIYFCERVKKQKDSRGSEYPDTRISASNTPPPTTTLREMRNEWFQGWSRISTRSAWNIFLCHTK